MGAPIKPFHCRVCGENKPQHFNAWMKSLCANCRSDRERERYWANAARIGARYRASINAARDEQANDTSDALAVLYGFARQEHDLSARQQ